MTRRRTDSPAAIRLGAVLRLAMRITGLNQREIAHRLGWDPSTVSRLLSGQSGGHRAAVRAFLAQCAISEAHREGILALSLPCHICGCPGDHDEQSTTEERSEKPMVDILEQTKKNLQQAAGQHIVRGNPIEAQRIQRALQGAKKESKPK